MSDQRPAPAAALPTERQRNASDDRSDTTTALKLPSLST
jgi:hypothetical protein